MYGTPASETPSRYGEGTFSLTIASASSPRSPKGSLRWSIKCKNVWVWNRAICHAKSESCIKSVLHDCQKLSSTFDLIERQFPVQDRHDRTLTEFVMLCPTYHQTSWVMEKLHDSSATLPDPDIFAVDMEVLPTIARDPSRKLKPFEPLLDPQVTVDDKNFRREAQKFFSFPSKRGEYAFVDPYLTLIWERAARMAMPVTSYHSAVLDSKSKATERYKLLL